MTRAELILELDSQLEDATLEYLDAKRRFADTRGVYYYPQGHPQAVTSDNAAARKKAIEDCAWYAKDIMTLSAALVGLTDG